ncbi:MAG: N-acetyltransferase [Pirellulales bacterium]|nr:N-acetyltransferase [Pirellulales bacterium]
MIIRPESAGDYESIRDILVAAFANHPYSHQTEHLIVEALRDADALSVALVAEIDGKVVGHIAFSPVKIDGVDCMWFGLGPLAVMPEFQRKGIGKSLVEEGLQAIRRVGAEGCVLVGDPAYYGRFGFRHTPLLKMEGVSPQYLLCLPMAEQIPAGQVSHHSAFFVCE